MGMHNARLPVELLDNIVDEAIMNDRSSVGNAGSLSFVCHHFRRRTLPHILEGRIYRLQSNTRILALCEIITKNPEIARYIGVIDTSDEHISNSNYGLSFPLASLISLIKRTGKGTYIDLNFSGGSSQAEPVVMGECIPANSFDLITRISLESLDRFPHLLIVDSAKLDELLIHDMTLLPKDFDYIYDKIQLCGLTNVTSLDLEDVSGLPYGLILACAALKDLTLSNVEIIGPEDDESALRYTRPMIEELFIYDYCDDPSVYALLDFAVDASNLKNLCFATCGVYHGKNSTTNLDIEIINALLDACSNSLERLQVNTFATNNLLRSDETSFYDFSRLLNLHTLDFATACGNVDEISLLRRCLCSHLLTFRPENKLEHLKLWFGTSIKDTDGTPVGNDETNRVDVQQPLAMFRDAEWGDFDAQVARIVDGRPLKVSMQIYACREEAPCRQQYYPYGTERKWDELDSTMKQWGQNTLALMNRAGIHVDFKAYKAEL